jgi:hypothetical protein
MPHLTARRRIRSTEAQVNTRSRAVKPLTRPGSDRPCQALPSVNRGVFCKGCEQPFTPVRATQQHCKPSCRVLACRRRKADQSTDLLASGIAAGHVEPDVVP